MAKAMTAEHLAKMQSARTKAAEGRRRATQQEFFKKTLSGAIEMTGKGHPRGGPGPLKAIRLNCLDCSGGKSKAVKYCPMDGVNSRRCPLWPFRFGFREKRARARYGDKFLSPEQMPDANTPIESLE